MVQASKKARAKSVGYRAGLLPRYVARLRHTRVTKTRRSLSSVKLPSGDSQGATTGTSTPSNSSLDSSELKKIEFYRADGEGDGLSLELDVGVLDQTIVEMEDVLTEVSAFSILTSFLHFSYF